MDMDGDRTEIKKQCHSFALYAKFALIIFCAVFVSFPITLYGEGRTH